jgi:hypothetical protein
MTSEVLERVKRELELISRDGSRAKLHENPDAVVYYGLPSSLGVVDSTDVMVVVPPGYPGATLDHAYLPSGSPLFNVVKGQPEGINLDVDGRKWQRVSYHPHNGGGAPSWDPTKHGFHTYVDEVLSWLSVRR